MQLASASGRPRQAVLACRVGPSGCSDIEDLAVRAHRISFWPPYPAASCDHHGHADPSQRRIASKMAQLNATHAECRLLPESLEWYWNSTAGKCAPSRLGREQAAALLQCKTLTFIGDSIVRNLALAAAALLAEPNDPPITVEWHADMVFFSGCSTNITFLWRPFLANVTDALSTWTPPAGQHPHHIITGVALWDVLHSTGMHRYAADADAFVDAATPLLNAQDQDRAMWWVTTTAVHQARLQTAEKRATLTQVNLQRYRAAQRMKVQQPLAHSTAFHVLDVHAVTRQAPAAATEDGIHFNAVVYEAAVQVLLNMVQAEAGGRAGDRQACTCAP
eukprot:jgi/Ulvmu1/1375/UM011_0103.1